MNSATSYSLTTFSLRSILGITLGLIAGSYLSMSSSQSTHWFSWEQSAVFAIIGLLINESCFFLSVFLDRIISWKFNSGLRMILGLLLLMCGSLLILSLAVFIHDWITGERLLQALPDLMLKVLIVLFIFILGYNSCYFAFYSHRTYVRHQLATLTEERKQIDLQLKALKSQLSPHFLFNSLNTVSSLSWKDVQTAQLFVRKLAKMYQYTLDSYHHQLITVAEELEFLASYQFLLYIRFGDRLVVDIDLPKDMHHSKIPPLTLQMLMENAVKHNVMQSDKPLRVSYFIKDNCICVKNNVLRSPKRVSSFSIGLKNINSRYLLLANQAISVSNGSDFQVKLPIIL